jgi:hypothetical protein
MDVSKFVFGLNNLKFDDVVGVILREEMRRKKKKKKQVRHQGMR